MTILANLDFMYTDYFGLTEKPFSIAPDPGYLYMSESHREALAHLLYGLQTDGGFVLLTGEVGTGKTTICKSLFNQIPPEVDLAFVLNPKITVLELLQTICDELHIQYVNQTSTKLLVDNINQHLLHTNSQGRKTVLLIDEAQNLSIDVLEQLRLLTNLETDKRKLLQIILLGQPELRYMINRPQLRQLAQRITARYHLGPLEKKDIEGYISHRIQVAGGQNNFFTPRAMVLIHKLSLGVPRLINLLCDRALLGAYTQQQEAVTPTIVRQAGHEIFASAPRKISLNKIILICVCAVTIGGIAYTQLPVSNDDIATNQSTSEKIVKATSPESTPIPTEQPQQVEVQSQPQIQAWPDDFGFGNSANTAFRDLASLWGLNYISTKVTPCDFAYQSGLRCYERRENLTTLEALNRPAMLTLYDDSGHEFYVVLAQVRNGMAEFHVGKEIRNLPLSVLQNRWFGEYRILWSPPQAYSGVVYPGEQDPLIFWLIDTLSIPQPEQEKANSSLAGTILGALKQFQFTTGLTPDGVLGPKTLIHLNQLRQTSGPYLTIREDN